MSDGLNDSADKWWKKEEPITPKSWPGKKKNPNKITGGVLPKAAFPTDAPRPSDTREVHKRDDLLTRFEELVRENATLRATNEKLLNGALVLDGALDGSRVIENKLEDEIARLRNLLCQIEFCIPYFEITDISIPDSCPVCDNREDKGHADNCELASELKGEWVHGDLPVI